MKFSKGIKKLESSGIRKVFDLAQKIKNPVNLSIGEPDFKIPPSVKNELIKAIKNDKNKYTLTAGLPELREAVVLKLKKENKIKASLDNVIITSGTSGAMHLLFQVLLNSGDEVIVLDPYFVIHKYIPETFGAKVVLVSSYPDFSLPVSKIEKAITPKTKMVIINSPNNPTGKVYSEEEIKDLVDVLKKKNILLVSDEIYEKFVYPVRSRLPRGGRSSLRCNIGGAASNGVYDGKHFSPASIYKNTITLNGFSKSHALTGLRIGYAVGPGDIISEMAKLQQYTYVCAPSISQYAAIRALKTDTSPAIKEYEKKRDLIYQGLKKNFQVQKPEGAFYIFPKARNLSGDELVKRAVEKGLLIVPGSVFSSKNSHFRLSFASSLTNLKKGVRILNEVQK